MRHRPPLLSRGLSFAIASVFLGLTASFSVTPAVAQSLNHDLLSDSEYRQVIELLLSRGVESDVAAELAARVDRGETLLADDPDAEPIAVKELSQGVVRQYFADGSVSEAGTQRPDSVIKMSPSSGSLFAPTGTSLVGCRVATSGYYATYTNCRATYDGIQFKYSFLTTFSMSSGGSSVSRASDPIISRALGHSVSDVRAWIARAKSVGSTTPASGRMTFLATASIGGNVVNTKTVGISLYVYKNRYTFS